VNEGRYGKCAIVYPKHSWDRPAEVVIHWSVDIQGTGGRMSRTNEMKLLMESIARLYMFADARCLGSGIWETH
jgi:hypothetical protein